MFIVWVPGNLVIYCLPLHFQLIANHLLSFAWSVYLSLQHRIKKKHNGDISPETQQNV